MATSFSSWGQLCVAAMFSSQVWHCAAASVRLRKQPLGAASLTLGLGGRAGMPPWGRGGSPLVSPPGLRGSALCCLKEAKGAAPLECLFLLSRKIVWPFLWHVCLLSYYLFIEWSHSRRSCFLEHSWFHDKFIYRIVFDFMMKSLLLTSGPIVPISWEYSSNYFKFFRYLLTNDGSF